MDMYNISQQVFKSGHFRTKIFISGFLNSSGFQLVFFLCRLDLECHQPPKAPARYGMPDENHRHCGLRNRRARACTHRSPLRRLTSHCTTRERESRRRNKHWLESCWFYERKIFVATVRPLSWYKKQSKQRKNNLKEYNHAQQKKYKYETSERCVQTPSNNENNPPKYWPARNAYQKYSTTSTHHQKKSPSIVSSGWIPHLCPNRLHGVPNLGYDSRPHLLFKG